MKCDFCASKATVFLTQLVEGKMKKVCLCDSCAKEKGVTDPTGFSLADMLTSEFTETKPSRAAACPGCGFTLEDFQRIRRFGCPTCYHTFHHELTPVLRSMHKGSTHLGKIPGGLMAARFRSERIDELRGNLEQAVAAENYEEAAGIRDELRHLEEAATESEIPAAETTSSPS